MEDDERFEKINDRTKLVLIKLLHTAIWIFFNLVIFYMLYAVVNDRLSIWLWFGYVIIVGEAVILYIFNSYCPLTLWARNYSDSTKDNFDIYLPNWLAKYNKIIYSSIFGLVIVLTAYRLI